MLHMFLKNVGCNNSLKIASGCSGINGLIFDGTWRPTGTENSLKTPQGLNLKILKRGTRKI